MTLCDLTSSSWFRSLSFPWSLGSLAWKCVGWPLFPHYRWVRMDNDTLLALCQMEHGALWLGEWEWGMAGGKPTLGKWWLLGMGWAPSSAKGAELKSHSCECLWRCQKNKQTNNPQVGSYSCPQRTCLVSYEICNFFEYVNKNSQVGKWTQNTKKLRTTVESAKLWCSNK